MHLFGHPFAARKIARRCFHTLAAAEAGTPPLPTVRVRHVRVIRDYGLRERREAPQYFADVTYDKSSERCLAKL